MTLSSLSSKRIGESNWEKWGESINRFYCDYELNWKMLNSTQNDLKRSQETLENIKEAQKIITTLAEGIQQRVHERIAEVVSRCLTAVFDDPYEFRIIFEQKRGKTEARFVFIRDDQEIDPLTAAGGGVVDVAAFGLRIACLLLRKPKLRKLLVLDEPFRFVSRNYLPNLVKLIEGLANEMGIQIVMVTHTPELEVGKVVEMD